MKKSKILFILILIASLHYADAQEEDCDFADFSISLEKKQFAVCEPVVVSCTISIRSSTTIWFNNDLINDDFEIVLLDRYKNPVPYTRMGSFELIRKKVSAYAPPKGKLQEAIEEGTIRATAFSTRSIPLNNGHTIEMEFLLNRQFDLTKLGKYSVQIKAMHLSKMILGKPLPLQSNVLNFQIIDDERFGPYRSCKIASGNASSSIRPQERTSPTTQNKPRIRETQSNAHVIQLDIKDYQGNDLIIEATSDAREYAPCSPIPVYITVSNHSDRYFNYTESHFTSDYSIQVKKDNNEDAPLTSLGKHYRNISGDGFRNIPCALPPHYKIRNTIIINRLYDFSYSGNYSIIVSRNFTDPSSNRNEILKVHSNPLPITITGNSLLGSYRDATFNEKEEKVNPPMPIELIEQFKKAGFFFIEESNSKN